MLTCEPAVGHWPNNEEMLHNALQSAGDKAQPESKMWDRSCFSYGIIKLFRFQIAAAKHGLCSGSTTQVEPCDEVFFASIEVPLACGS